MGFTTLQNTQIVLDLAAQARSTGWTIVGNTAVHEACNAGYISVVNSLVDFVVGNSYTVTYQISNRTSGTIQSSLGTALGTSRNTNGNFSDTLVATGTNPVLKFYSDGALELRLLDIKPNTESVQTKQKNGVAFSETLNKYTTFVPFTSDYGFSFFKDLFTFKGGRLYKHDQDSGSRNNIYGVQYTTSIKIPFNANNGQPKTFESISYEGNELMITTTDGITTSLGQVSELISDDFLKATLVDGATIINVYDNEGIYSASFMRDKNIDIVNGDQLKGTMITVELITTNNSVLRLKNVIVNSVPSKIGSR